MPERKGWRYWDEATGVDIGKQLHKIRVDAHNSTDFNELMTKVMEQVTGMDKQLYQIPVNAHNSTGFNELITKVMEQAEEEDFGMSTLGQVGINPFPLDNYLLSA